MISMFLQLIGDIPADRDFSSTSLRRQMATCSQYNLLDSFSL